MVSKSRLDAASPRWQRQSGLLIGKDEIATKEGHC
jgi:hypothetical protein